MERIPKFRRVWKWLVVAGFLTGLFVSGGCGGSAPVSAEMPVPKVTTTAVVAQETIDMDEYTGRTEASESVEVRSRVFGFLKSIEFTDGDLVTEGKLLFKIEPDEYEAIHQQSISRIALHSARLELAEAKFQRNQKLVKSGAVSQEDYEEAVAAKHEAEAAITAAKADANRTALDVKYTEIKAPIAGRIDRALVSKGNLLTGGEGSGTLLTTIVQEQPMYVFFDVDERALLGYMRSRGNRQAAAPKHLRELNIKCFVKLSDEPDFTHEGVLDFVASELQTTTGTVRVRGLFANENRALASGMFVRIRIPVSDPYQAMLIPEVALATDQNIKFVYVVGADGTAERRSVVLGKQRGELRIVTKGLKAGEQVIVNGLQRVKPGQKVEAEVAKAVDTTASEPAAEHAKPAAKSAKTSTESATPAANPDKPAAEPAKSDAEPAKPAADPSPEKNAEKNAEKSPEKSPSAESSTSGAGQER